MMIHSTPIPQGCQITVIGALKHEPNFNTYSDDDLGEYTIP